jgi:hypothetical protein
MLKLVHRMEAFPRQLWLEISPAEVAAAIAQTQSYSNDIAQRNAYISCLCLSAMLNWFQTEPDFQTESISIIPEQTDLPSIWELLPGVVVQLGQVKLAFIPSETSEPNELIVPFEWIDIPNWAADYYLAVQLNLEADQVGEQWLRIWGFATHAQIKAGTCDPVKRVYQLDGLELTEDLNVLWTMRSLSNQPEAIDPLTLPTFSFDQLERLLHQLSQPTLYSPRLEVPFQQWAAILSNSHWRHLLYQRRLASRLTQAVPATATPINLRQWFQGVNQAIATTWQAVTWQAVTWQAVEAIISPAQLSPVRGVNTADSSLEAIVPILKLVQSTESEQIRKQAVAVLGEIGFDHPETIDVLVNLLQTSQSEETRWQAALSLGKIAPQHPLAGVRRARLLDLGLQLEQHAIALIVAIMPKSNDRVGVFLQVQSVDQQLNLPPHLKISVLTETGEARLQAESRWDEQGNGKDKSIDLRFTPPAGTRFQVRVELNDAYIVEEFLT